MKNLLTIAVLFFFYTQAYTQNVGIGTTTPEARLHIKGNADTSQLTIDANAAQSNARPLIRIRNAAGIDLLHIHSDGPTNTFLGLSAGRSNNANGGGVSNTFLGALSGYSNTLGYGNTVTGYAGLYSNSNGNYNTANGQGALYYNTTGDFNTASGYGALSYIGFSNYNVAMGYQALQGATSVPSDNNALANVAVGSKSLWVNSVGDYNIAVGNGALASNSSGSDNSGLGAGAMSQNTIGAENVAIGSRALYNNTDGSNSTAIGTNAMLYSRTGSNVAVGYESLRGSTTVANNSGFQNTAVGYRSLWSNSSGYSNTANGYAALYSNGAGGYNTASGQGALYANNDGAYNTATGYGALQSNVAGFDNTGIGYLALSELSGGALNIAVGAFSGVSTSTPALSNTISIGNGGYLNQVSNYAMFGNLSTVWNGGNMPWVTYASDSRVKDNVKEDVKGLDFIMRLHPVTYNLNIRSMQKITGNKDTPEYPEKYDVEKIEQSGFLAQQVEQAAKESGYNFSGVIIPKKETMLYSLSYEQFVVPLVKAVQELKALNDDKDKKINDLEARLKRLESLIGK